MTVQILTGDCREVLRTLPDESVHCVVTSPPYWGLRDYGTAQWQGGDPACDHIEVQPQGRPGRETPGGRGGTFPHTERAFKKECGKCGARRIDAQLGLEPSPAEYVANMVEVFREVRRVLRGDGTVWLNLGDSYASSGVSGKQSTTSNLDRHGANGFNPKMAEQLFGRAPTPDGLKPKDLIGIPWRVAFALQADGWYLRQDIIWSKPNPMPESVTDRCTKSHEYIFLLSKNERYFYDAIAIQEPFAYSGDVRMNTAYAVGTDKRVGSKYREAVRQNGRNKRSVWTVATQPFSEAHFATFPPALIEPCILAGVSEKCCAKCGAPHFRDIEKGDLVSSGPNGLAIKPRSSQRTLTASALEDRPKDGWGDLPKRERFTVGWLPSCSCNTGTVPGTCLDPFGGAGTTGLVADRLGRNAVLIELNPTYTAMIERRIKNDAGMFANLATQSAS